MTTQLSAREQIDVIKAALADLAKRDWERELDAQRERMDANLRRIFGDEIVAAAIVLDEEALDRARAR